MLTAELVPGHVMVAWSTGWLCTITAAREMRAGYAEVAKYAAYFHPGFETERIC